MGEAGAGLAVVSGTRLTDRIGIGVLTRLIDRDLVDDVLAETGRIEKRSRLLPARVVVYYVLALCLFFGDAYEGSPYLTGVPPIRPLRPAYPDPVGRTYGALAAAPLPMPWTSA